jgi:hypothetical protein
MLQKSQKPPVESTVRRERGDRYMQENKKVSKQNVLGGWTRCAGSVSRNFS